MGNNQNKEPQQINITTGELQMKSKFVAGQLEHQVDKLVNKIMRDERNLLNKYSEGRRSIEDMLFKDEVRISISVFNFCLASDWNC
jgi:hypothetical protein